MRNFVFLPVKLIKTADEDGWLRSLAYFVRLKSLYKNNTHYNFTSRSLSDKINCSPATLLFHLKVLEQKGLIRYHAKNISFLGYRKLQSLYGNKFIGVPVDSKQQHDILRGQIIRFNLKTQLYNINKSGSQKLRCRWSVPNTKSEKRSSCYTGLSAKQTGILFNLSQSSGSRIRTKLNKNGILKVERCFSILYRNVTLQGFKILRDSFYIPQYSFLRDGNVCVERRSRIEYNGNRKVASKN